MKDFVLLEYVRRRVILDEFVVAMFDFEEQVVVGLDVTQDVEGGAGRVLWRTVMVTVNRNLDDVSVVFRSDVLHCVYLVSLGLVSSSDLSKLPRMMSIIRIIKMKSSTQTVCPIDFWKWFHYTVAVATGDSGQALYEATGELIRKARTARKLTQTELAAGVGLTRTSVVNIEKGRQKLLLHTLFGFAAVLGVEPVDLLPTQTESLEGYGARAETVPAHLSLATQDFIRFAMRKTVIADEKAPS